MVKKGKRFEKVSRLAAGNTRYLCNQQITPRETYTCSLECTVISYADNLHLLKGRQKTNVIYSLENSFGFNSINKYLSLN